MSFFWPTTQNPEPGALGRAGRVLHWTAIVVGLVPSAIGAVVIGTAGLEAYNSAAAVLVGLWAAAFAMAGRGLRYILAGE